MNSPFNNLLDEEQDYDEISFTASGELEFRSPFNLRTNTNSQTEPDELVSDEYSGPDYEAYYELESDSNFENDFVTTDEEQSDYLAYPESEDFLPPGQNAVALNEQYGKSLGWVAYAYEINELLLEATNQSGKTLFGSSFSSAVSAWQQKNGIGMFNAKGVIDPITWNVMKPVLSSFIVSNVARIWGDKEKVAKSFDRILGLKLNFPMPMNYASLDSAGKKVYQAEWLKMIALLFDSRKASVMSGRVPALLGAQVPFGFQKQTRGNITGLKTFGKNLRWLKTELTENVLLSLYKQKKITLSQDEFDLCQRISNAETYGMIQLLNTYDLGIVSIGFFQFTLHVGKIQQWIKKNEPAFRKYGIELDPTATYTFGDNGQVPAIKGISQKNINDIRFNGWAERFYYAGLDPDIIVAEVEMARDYFAKHLTSLQRRLKDIDVYNTFISKYYDQDAFVRGLFQASFNNNPAGATNAVRNAVRKFKSPANIADFSRTYTQAVKNERKHWDELPTKTSRGATHKLSTVDTQNEWEQLVTRELDEFDSVAEDEFSDEEADGDHEALYESFSYEEPEQTGFSDDNEMDEQEHAEPEEWLGFGNIGASFGAVRAVTDAIIKKSSIQTKIKEIVRAELAIWNGKNEKDKGMYAFVKKYWVEGVGFSSSDADEVIEKRKRTGKEPWSAAFISYVMRKSSDGKFFKARAHNRYTVWANNNRGTGVPFEIFKIDDATIEVGDIVVNTRVNRENTNPASYKSLIDPEAGNIAHGDVVIEVDYVNHFAVAAGGNKPGVKSVKIELTPDNKVKQKMMENKYRKGSYGHYVAVVKLMPPLKPGTTPTKELESFEGEENSTGKDWCSIRKQISYILGQAELDWYEVYDPSFPQGRFITEGEKNTDGTFRMLDYLTEYWKAVQGSGANIPSYKVTNPAYHAQQSAKNDEAWSAAFVSWAMMQSGVSESDGFIFSRRHMTYIVKALSNARKNSTSEPIHLRDVGTSVKAGDILCFNVYNNGWTNYTLAGLGRQYLDQRNEVRDLGSVAGSSHCDIVKEIITEGSKRFAIVVGGNKSVVMGGDGVAVNFRRIELDANNVVMNPGSIRNPGSMFAVIKLGDCVQTAGDDETEADFENFSFDESEFETDEENYPDQEELVRELSKAIEQNRHFASSLGWDKYYEQINNLLLPFAGAADMSLGEESFARAVSDWQVSQGLTQAQADGVIGPNTWARMRPFLNVNPIVSPPVSSGSIGNAPPVHDIYAFNRYYAQKVLDAMSQGFVAPTHGFGAMGQLEKILKGEQIHRVNPRTAIIQALPVMAHICDHAKINNYKNILIGSFIRPPAPKKCTGHCLGKSIDINFKGGSFEDAGATEMVRNILGYLTTISSPFRKSFGFGMPFQGSFFHNKNLPKFDGTSPANIADVRIRQLITELGYVFPDNKNHLHIQVNWLS